VLARPRSPPFRQSKTCAEPVRHPLANGSESSEEAQGKLRECAENPEGHSPPACALDPNGPNGAYFVLLQTVVETRHFILRVRNLLSEIERHELIDFIGSHPLKGDVVPGTGGLRKLRFGRGARGTSGGVRVVYYYYDADHPIFLLEIFGKSEKADLTKAERNALAKVVTEIKAELRRSEV